MDFYQAYYDKYQNQLRAVGYKIVGIGVNSTELYPKLRIRSLDDNKEYTVDATDAMIKLFISDMRKLCDADIANLCREIGSHYNRYKIDGPNKLVFEFTNLADFIKRVIFNDPATIVIWTDDSKTVVKCENEPYDPEKGLAMCIAKRAMGNTGNYYNIFKKFLPEKAEEKTTVCENDVATNYEEALNALKEYVNRLNGI